MCLCHPADHDCPSCVCVLVPLLKICFLVDWRLLVKEHIANIGIPLDIFRFMLFLLFRFFCFNFGLQTIVMCGLEELAGGVSVDVAIGISDRWHVTCDRWQVRRNRWPVTLNTWSMTHDMWRVNHDIYIYFSFCPFLSFLVWSRRMTHDTWHMTCDKWYMRKRRRKKRKKKWLLTSSSRKIVGTTRKNWPPTPKKIWTTLKKNYRKKKINK